MIASINQWSSRILTMRMLLYRKQVLILLGKLQSLQERCLQICLNVHDKNNVNVTRVYMSTTPSTPETFELECITLVITMRILLVSANDCC